MRLIPARAVPQRNLPLNIAMIRDRLPEEGRKWLDTLSREESQDVETILNNVGAESFVENWSVHKADLDHVRNF